MFDVNDILARLQSGESIEDIGNEIAGLMNSAVEQHNIQKEKELEAQKAKKQKIADAKALMDLTADYLRKYYPDVKIDDAEDVDAFISMLDTIMPMVNSITAAGETIRSAMPRVEVKTYTGKDAEDVFKRFFQRHGI